MTVVPGLRAPHPVIIVRDEFQYLGDDPKIWPERSLGAAAEGRTWAAASHLSQVTARLTPALTPHGRLVLVASDDAPPLDAAVARRLIDAFERGPGHGLLQLGGAEIGEPLPPAFSYWRELGTRYVTAVCTSPDVVRQERPQPPPPASDLEALALGAPVMPGAEYITVHVLAALWQDTDTAFRERLAETRSTVEQLLKELNPAWNVVGRVHFNLAFNARDEEAPFAFLATYTHQLSAHGRAQHVPLGDALREYAGARNRDRLLSLLLPVQRAADRLDWLREMVDAGEIFHPLRWTAADAFRFLSAVPELEHAGVIVRVPADWSAKRAPRPQVTATVGSRPPAGLGADALVDFRMELSLDGERLTADEIETLLSGARRLALVRGRWIEVDPEQLRRTVERFRDTERLAAEHGLSFAEAARLLSGADITGDRVDAAVDPTWSRVTAGPWLASVLADLRAPGRMEAADLEQDLHGTLREYRAGWRALAPPAHAVGTRRVPRRRHGARQDHPGIGAAPRAAPPNDARPGPKSHRARRPRCSRTGSRK